MRILTITLILLSQALYSQDLPTYSVDSIKIAVSDVIRIAQDLESANNKATQQQLLAQEMRKQILLYETLKMHDDELIKVMDKELELRRTLYEQLSKTALKQRAPWKELGWFVGGMFITGTIVYMTNVK